MERNTVHRVEGVGTQRINDSTPFNPEFYEQAIHGLQKLILDLVRYDDERHTENYAPEHEPTTENNNSVLKIEPETVLDDLIKYIPSGWNKTIVNDLMRDYGYGIRASLDCGGGVYVFINIFVENGALRRFDVGHSDLVNPAEEKKFKSYGPLSSSKEIAYLNRHLERTVDQSYAKTIPSAATAFDYIATKEDTPSIGNRRFSLQNGPNGVSQKEWSDIRGKTQQTVSDNVRKAREQFLDMPSNTAFDQSDPALKEIDQDAEDTGAIRLV